MAHSKRWSRGFVREWRAVKAEGLGRGIVLTARHSHATGSQLTGLFGASFDDQFKYHRTN